ncbi:MAG: hypothetical protein M1470_13485 [Bacteroidetes bacterium]|nr:hypothetical protein [Bacteroidota bacterium]
MNHIVSESPQVGIATSANGEVERSEMARNAPLGPMGLRWRSCGKSGQGLSTIPLPTVS